MSGREAEADAGKAGKPVEPLFTPMERTGAAVIALAALAAVIAFMSGAVKL